MKNMSSHIYNNIKLAMSFFSSIVNQGKAHLKASNDAKLNRREKISIARLAMADAKCDCSKKEYASELTHLGICIAYFSELKIQPDFAECVIKFATCMLKQDMYEDGITLLYKARNMLLRHREYDRYVNCTFAINVNLFHTNRYDEMYINLTDVSIPVLRECSHATRQIYYMNRGFLCFYRQEMRGARHYYLMARELTPPENEETLLIINACLNRIEDLMRVNNF